MEPLNQQQHNGVYKPRFLMALVLAWLSSAGFYFWFSAGHTSDTFGGAIGYALGYLLPIALIGFFVLRKARDPASLRTRSIIIAALTIVLIASAIYEDTVALKGSIRSECAKSISAENQSNGDKYCDCFADGATVIMQSAIRRAFFSQSHQDPMEDQIYVQEMKAMAASCLPQ